MPLATGARFAALGVIELVRLPFKPPSFSVQQHWHRLYQHEPRNAWLRAQVARLFNDATDEWVEIEAALYGKEMRQRPPAGRRAAGSRTGAGPRVPSGLG